LFTKKYTTFKEWLAEHPQDSAYKRRIVRLHELHPEAPLSELRGHAPKNEHKPIESQ
jgi:hypothetical protein